MDNLYASIKDITANSIHIQDILRMSRSGFYAYYDVRMKRTSWIRSYDLLQQNYLSAI